MWVRVLTLQQKEQVEMNILNLKTRRRPLVSRGLFSLTALAIAVSGAMMIGCSSDSSSSRATADALPVFPEPLPLDVVGDDLACGVEETDFADAATIAAFEIVEPNGIKSFVASRDQATSSELNGNANNTIKRLTAVVSAQDPSPALVLDGDEAEIPVRPIVMSYAEQVIGPYALGDGSADIGDPTQIDDMFVSLSMDNGQSWKKEQVAKTSEKSSIKVTWGQNAISTDYLGHSHKPTMATWGNNILVAWNDKYCPSGNPFGLVQEEDGSYPDDLYKVNGKQGSIDYGGIVAPNEKSLYEVPFSCVWTARGVFGDPGADGFYKIQWRQAEQLTTGTRDSNKIWIAAEDIGFALTWQEDTEGLRSGKGAGPGEGYSGATTNHGTDIWYTHIPLATFNDVCEDADGEDNLPNTEDDCAVVLDGEDIDAIELLEEKPKVAVNFAYPVRISNNAPCSPDPVDPDAPDAKTSPAYCTDLSINPLEPEGDLVALNCIETVFNDTGSQGNDQQVERCIQADMDYMTLDTTFDPAAAVLDGDTGASRPALKILKTDAVGLVDDPETPDVDESLGEYIAILAYEETKGLSESDPGVPNSDDPTTDIAAEGKAVYFESFVWNQPVTVSASRPVNLRVPGVTITKDPETNDAIVGAETGLDIYENARRVVIATQVDSCDTGTYTFGLMYKQGYETQGGPADMFIRMNTGFTYEEFEDVALNVSSHGTELDVDDKPTGQIVWDAAINMADQSYTIPDDNTFSPRILLRGEEIYIGFEFTHSWRKTSQGTSPNNFWVNRYVEMVMVSSCTVRRRLVL